MDVAMLLYPGVFADECWAFDAVCSRLPGASVTRVGHRRGPVAGLGERQVVANTFDEVLRADVVVVPGGFGCQVYAADERLLDWLHTVGSRSTWLLASSTGSVIVAAGHLLDGSQAATQWLAVPLLEGYGVRWAEKQVVTDGRVLTCQGSVSALELGLHVALSIGGAALVDEIREDIWRTQQPAPRRKGFWRSVAHRLLGDPDGEPPLHVVDLGDLEYLPFAASARGAERSG